jgi:XisH protein
MAKDIFHEIVKEALIKDGWTITHDPYKIKLEERRSLNVDLAAQRVLAAERKTEKIAVEIKSFLSESFMHDFYEAYGQYSVYENFIEEQEPDRTLYLAIDNEVFESDFEDKSIVMFRAKNPINLIVFNPYNKTIEEWIK